MRPRLPPSALSRRRRSNWQSCGRGFRGFRRGWVAAGVKAVWLDASSSLTYYSGLSLGLSERIHGALVPATGAMIYVSPRFEAPKLQTLLRIPCEIAVWEEHEDPYALIASPCGGL
jgi:Xaa-Pro dipeptidase